MTEMTRTENIKAFTAESTERFRGIWTSTRRILTYSPLDHLALPKKVVCASIEEGGVSVAYCDRTFARVNLKSLQRTPFQDGTYPQPKDVTSSLALSFNEYNLSAANITLGIPKSWIILKIAEFPSTVRENIPGVVAGELDRLTPFSADEAFFDFRVMSDDGERLLIMVMAVRTSTVMPYLNDLRENGYVVNRITASFTGAGTLYQYMSQKADNIIMDLSTHEYIGSLFISGLLTRTCSGVMTDDNEARFFVVSECIRNLTNTAAQEGVSPDIVALFSSENDSLRPPLEAEIGRPLKTMEAAETKMEFLGTADNISFATVGCAIQSMHPEVQNFNLLTKGIRQREKTPVALTCILLIALMCIWLFHIVYPITLEEERLQKISAEISNTQNEARNVEALKKEMDAITSEISSLDDFKHEFPMRLDILRLLTDVIPDGSYLTKLRIADDAVELEGYSGSAVELLPKLDAARYFRKVEFTSPTIRDARLNADRFRIKMEIAGDKNMVAAEEDNAEE